MKPLDRSGIVIGVHDSPDGRFVSAIGFPPFPIGEVRSVEVRQLAKRWKFPADPFIEYEPSDEAWCRPLRIGCEVWEVTTITIPRLLNTGNGYQALSDYDLKGRADHAE